MNLKLKRIRSRKDLEKTYSIRMRVFVREQGVPREIELDSDDEKALHLLAFVGEKAVGTARVVVKGRTAKIGRMAVLKSYRGRGVGRKLLKHAVNMARKKGAEYLFLHAQSQVTGFYQKLGFRSRGGVFLEAGIPHRKMVLEK